MAYENLIVERDGPVVRIAFNRPHVLNALSRATMRDLDVAVDEVAADTSARALILTGTGDKAFVAGADIGEFNLLTSASDSAAFARRGQAVLAKLEALPKPVIAAINGFALGGGCELALACDLRIASEKAKVGQPEVSLGVTPGFGGTQRLARLVGPSDVKYLLFTGEVLPASRALQLGLFDEVVAPEQLLPRCLEIARTIAAKGPAAVAFCKVAVDQGADTALAQGLGYETELFAQTFATRDQKEGMKAFVEKRPPRFQGD